ncbi:MAG TPA: hypothetical protein VEA38_06650 [Terriglobales bacterium]|nr:hypothetical protein [Terriglobales bacterium]
MTPDPSTSAASSDREAVVRLLVMAEGADWPFGETADAILAALAALGLSREQVNAGIKGMVDGHERFLSLNKMFEEALDQRDAAIARAGKAEHERYEARRDAIDAHRCWLNERTRAADAEADAAAWKQRAEKAERERDEKVSQAFDLQNRRVQLAKDHYAADAAAWKQRAEAMREALTEMVEAFVVDNNVMTEFQTSAVIKADRALAATPRAGGEETA